MAQHLLQSSTAHPLLFLLVQSADHLTGLTGATPTVTLSKDGATFAAPSGAVTELANGWYKVAGNATDTATLGALLLHATATSADPCDMVFQVVAFNPDDAVHLGLSALPNTAAGAAGGLATATNSSGQVTASSVVGAVASVTGNVGGNVTGSVGSVAGAVSGAVGSVTGNVGGNVTGSVGSVVGAVASVAGAVGSVTGNVGGSVGNLASGAQTDVRSALTAQGLTTTRAAGLDDLDAAVSSRLAGSSYTAPNNAGISTALSDLSSLLGRTDPTTALAAIQTVTDQLRFSTANQVDARALTNSDKTGYALTSGEHTAIAGTDVPTALGAAGLSAAFVQQLSALLGSASVSGNVVTYASPDDAHHWTQTYSPSIDAATSVAVAQVD